MDTESQGEFTKRLDDIVHNAECEAREITQRLDDDIAEPHAFIAYQYNDGLLSNIKVCANLREVREYQAAHRRKQAYGIELISGAFGWGKIAYFAIYPVH